MKNLKGSILLLIAAFIWGTAFVAQTSGSKFVPAFTFNAVRSFVGAIFLWLVHYLSDTQRKRRIPEYVPGKWPVKGGIICGLVISFAMGSQQLGIGMYPDGVAASGRAGFLTATYVVMVAVYSQIYGRKIHPLIVTSVVGVICGMYMLCMSGGFGAVYIGDVFLIICAICYTAHILVIDRFSSCDSIKLSCIQFVTCGIVSSVAALISDEIIIDNIINAAGSILFTGIMSSGVAFTLQMVGQKYAEPAVASIVMSLESVFSVIAGWLVLGEMLTHKEMLGCVLVFVSVILAQVPQFRKKAAVS